MIKLKVNEKGKVVTVITLDDFMIAVENEGFEGVAHYYGTLEIEGHTELTNAFKEFQEFLDILEDHYVNWDAEQTEEGEVFDE